MIAHFSIVISNYMRNLSSIVEVCTYLHQAILSNSLSSWELYLPIVSIWLWCAHGREASSSGIALLSLPLLVPRDA